MKGKTLFTEVLGSNPEIRALDFLLTHRTLDYSLTTICRNAGVGWSTIHIFWPRWVKNKIVLKTRRISRAQLYELNKDHPFVKGAMVLHDVVLMNFLASEIEKNKKAKSVFDSTKKAAVKA